MYGYVCRFSAVSCATAEFLIRSECMPLQGSDTIIKYNTVVLGKSVSMAFDMVLAADPLEA